MGGGELNPYDVKTNLNFDPLEVVYRYRDPQFQVGKNYDNTVSINVRTKLNTTRNEQFFERCSFI